MLAILCWQTLACVELLCPLPGTVALAFALGLSAFYVWFSCLPAACKRSAAAAWLRASIGGYELLLVSFDACGPETVFYIVLLCTGMPLDAGPYSAPWWVAFVAKTCLVFLPLVGDAAGKRLFSVWRSHQSICGWCGACCCCFCGGCPFSTSIYFPVCGNRAQGILFPSVHGRGQRRPILRTKLQNPLPHCAGARHLFRDWQLFTIGAHSGCAAPLRGRKFIMAGSNLPAGGPKRGRDWPGACADKGAETGEEKKGEHHCTLEGRAGQPLGNLKAGACAAGGLAYHHQHAAPRVFAQHLLSTMPKGAGVDWCHKYNSLFHYTGGYFARFSGRRARFDARNLPCFQRGRAGRA